MHEGIKQYTCTHLMENECLASDRYNLVVGENEKLKKQLEETENIIKLVMELKPCDLCKGVEKECEKCRHQSEWELVEC